MGGFYGCDEASESIVAEQEQGLAYINQVYVLWKRFYPDELLISRNAAYSPYGISTEQ